MSFDILARWKSSRYRLVTSYETSSMWALPWSLLLRIVIIRSTFSWTEKIRVGFPQIFSLKDLIIIHDAQLEVKILNDCREGAEVRSMSWRWENWCFPMKRVIRAHQVLCRRPYACIFPYMRAGSVHVS